MGAPHQRPSQDPILEHGQVALAQLSAVIVELRKRAEHERASRLNAAYLTVARELSTYRERGAR